MQKTVLVISVSLSQTQKLTSIKLCERGYVSACVCVCVLTHRYVVEKVEGEDFFLFFKKI